MADEAPNAMNLDLNLGPGSMPEQEGNLDEWIHDPAYRMASRQRWRWRHFEDPLETQNLNIDSSQFRLTSVGTGNQGGLLTGEGSVAAEERVPEVEKICENKSLDVDDETLVSKEEDEKGGSDDGSFYDCNICFELAKDPIITCCGHLYCWSCIYRWLHIHSECPVCKGEVTTKNVTPVYGRGHNNRVPEEDLMLRIPPRPGANRVEGVHRTNFAFPMEEMMRHLGSRFDPASDFYENQDLENAATVNAPYRNPTYLLNRLTATRTMRRGQLLTPPENIMQSRASSPDALGHSEGHTRLVRRSETNISINTSSPSPSSMSPTERVIEAYIRTHPVILRRPEQSSPIDDRDSYSSIAAVMHSGSHSQTMDTAVEIDSVVSLSTSSSRRRNDTSRASDVDSGESRPPRRRRLN